MDEQLTDLGPIDTDYLGDYEEAAAPRKRPLPGRYKLQLPSSISVQRKDFGAGKRFLEFSLTGTTIAEGDFAGTELNKYYRATTQKKPNGNFSEAGDILRAFGIDVSNFTTAEEWVNAFNSIAGQVSPGEVYLNYSGNYKPEGATRRTYLKAASFRQTDADGNESYLPFLYLVDGTPQQEAPAGLNAQELRALPKVWANLEPGMRGWVSSR